MADININEYVRTKQGYIAKLQNKDNEFLYFDNSIYCYYEESPLLPINMKLLDGTYIKAEEYIAKHSKNIIDLIEERRFCK